MAGLEADPWQARALRSHSDRLLFLCSRQGGKSLTAAAMALCECLTRPGSLTLLLSPTQRQSGELFREKLLRLLAALPARPRARRLTATELVLSNDARVVSLPENEAGVRCFSAVTLLVIDEAARTDDALYHAVRPMLATTNGRLVALSTPFGQRGFFWEEWERGGEWERYRVPASECSRISAEFLADERQSKGPRWFKQEYECSFEAATDAVFDPAAVRRAVRPGEVLFGG